MSESTLASRESVIRALVAEHFSVEPGVEKILDFTTPESPNVRFLEVNSDTISTGHVDAFRFPPNKLCPWPISIADVTPAEYELVKSGKIPLPKDWPSQPTMAYDRPSPPEA